MDSKNKTNRRQNRRVRTPLVTRRRFFKTAGIASAAITTGFGTATISAAELPRVSEDDQIAKSLNYVHDASTVEEAKRAPDRFCNNCALYAGDAGDEWAGCSIFAGKAVAGKGWCTAWVPKPSS